MLHARKGKILELLEAIYIVVDAKLLQVRTFFVLKDNKR